eukprot:218679_1
MSPDVGQVRTRHKLWVETQVPSPQIKFALSRALHAPFCSATVLQIAVSLTHPAPDAQTLSPVAQVAVLRELHVRTLSTQSPSWHSTGVSSGHWRSGVQSDRVALQVPSAHLYGALS